MCRAPDNILSNCAMPDWVFGIGMLAQAGLRRGLGGNSVDLVIYEVSLTLLLSTTERIRAKIMTKTIGAMISQQEAQGLLLNRIQFFFRRALR